MSKKMIVVGAGIAGISTGCYARMNGYDSKIFEMHSIPGGLCTAWKRKGYTFDISMHMLTGSKSGPLHQMWQELGVVQNQPFHYHEDVVRIESGDKVLNVCTDALKLEEQMVALSPEDAELSREFVRLVTGRHMMNALSLKPEKMVTLGEKLKMFGTVLPMLGTFRKYGEQTVQEFAERFSDPFLRQAVRFFIDSPGWPMLRFPMVAMAGFMNSSVKQAGAPIGGSQKVVYGMADYYKALGGEIFYKSRVADVIVENDRAVGVRLDDGSEEMADVVVWAADGRTAIFDVLEGRYINDSIQSMYDNWLPTRPMLHVALGVNRDMSREPHRIIFELEKPVTIAGEEKHWMSFLHHSFDATMAPEGKSAVEVWYATRYDYWRDLARDRVAYETEKKRIADFTIAELEKRWPGFAADVEVVDVPTPHTYVRYTGNWQGSPDGWYVTPENMMTQEPLRSLPGLSGFYMVGQWTRPFTGTVMAALSGRQLVQWLCKLEREPFVTTIQ